MTLRSWGVIARKKKEGVFNFHFFNVKGSESWQYRGKNKPRQEARTSSRYQKVLYLVEKSRIEGSLDRLADLQRRKDGRKAIFSEGLTEQFVSKNHFPLVQCVSGGKYTGNCARYNWNQNNQIFEIQDWRKPPCRDLHAPPSSKNCSSSKGLSKASQTWHV